MPGGNGLPEGPSVPVECVALIEALYGDKCIILPSARSSAETGASLCMGRDLLELLNRLVAGFRSALMEGGDIRHELSLARASMPQTNPNR
jgi:hypothetical protein